jgi:hypothetical protein
MARLSRIATDTDKASDGQWIEFCPAQKEGDKPLELKVARMGNPSYNQRLQELVRPHRRKVRMGFDEDLEGFVKIAVAECCLVDWRGMFDDDDKLIKYSKAKSVEILTDPIYVDLFDFVMEVAGDAAVYREAVTQDAAGNSRSSSTGSSTTAKTRSDGKS